jgi:hypothetical protein
VQENTPANLFREKLNVLGLICYRNGAINHFAIHLFRVPHLEERGEGRD